MEKKQDVFEKCFEQIEVGKPLGKGTYSSTYRGQFIDDGKDIILKFIPSCLIIPAIQLNFKSEIERIASLRHPALVPFLGYILPGPENPFHYIFISEYMGGGSLQDVFGLSFLSTQKTATKNEDSIIPPWTPIQRAITFFGLTAGLSYLHANGIKHCYLKPENILFDSQMKPYISDYFLSSLILSDPARPSNSETYSYQAPELFSYTGFDEKVDIYSYGCLSSRIFENVSLKDFSELDESYLIESNFYPSFSSITDQTLHQLLTQSISKNPDTRPTISQFLAYLAVTNSPPIFGTDQQMYNKYKEIFVEDSEKFEQLSQIAKSASSKQNISELRKKARMGDAKAQEHLAELIENGNAGQPSVGGLSEAASYYCKAASQGSITAAYHYALMLEWGIGVHNSHKKAALYFKAAADAGHVEAAIRYADILFNSGDTEGAALYYRKAGNSEDPSVLFRCAEKLLGNENKAGIQFLQRAAVAGSPGAQYQYGMRQDVSQEKGLNFIKAAADKGHSAAESVIGTILTQAKMKNLDVSDGLRYLKSAADQNDIPAMIRYASLLEEGRLIPKDHNEAIKYFKAAADMGDVEGQFHYAALLQIDGNQDESIKYYKRAADQGHTDSQIAYALALYKRKDPESTAYFRKAALKGDKLGQLYYGVALRFGFGVTQNLKDAFFYFNQAAKQEDLNAIYFLGMSYTKGEGVEADPEKGFKLIRLAAGKGLTNAITYLGQLYEIGLGCEKNLALALTYFRRASELGDSSAQALYNHCADALKEEKQKMDTLLQEKVELTQKENSQ